MRCRILSLRSDVPKGGKMLTKHHIQPKSRGGKNGEVIFLPERFHEAWHYVFGNLTNEEAVIFIAVLFDGKREVTLSTINKLRKNIRKGKYDYRYRGFK